MEFLSILSRRHSMYDRPDCQTEVRRVPSTVFSITERRCLSSSTKPGPINEITIIASYCCGTPRRQRGYGRIRNFTETLRNCNRGLYLMYSDQRSLTSNFLPAVYIPVRSWLSYNLLLQQTRFACQ